MVGKACSGRLQKEYKALIREPRPNIEAHPLPTNVLEWHYALTGPAGSDYEGGVYHGKIIFPSDYPFKAPGIVMCTPSGRFSPNAKICMSMTDFHPESWQPMWSVGTILTGLLSFMLEDAPTTGSITSTSEEKRQLAAQSLEFNTRNLQFRKIFPNWCVEFQRRQTQQQPSIEAPSQASAPTAERPQQAVGGGLSGTVIAAACFTALLACTLYIIWQSLKQYGGAALSMSRSG